MGVNWGSSVQAEVGRCELGVVAGGFGAALPDRAAGFEDADVVGDLQHALGDVGGKDRMARGDVAHSLLSMQRAIHTAAQQMPMHQQFVAHYCAAQAA